MLESLLAALKAVALNTMQSIGAALAHGFSAMAAGFLPAEREILVKVKAKFYQAYQDAKSAGAEELNAIEAAGTAALNEFCADETAFMAQEASQLIGLLVSSLKSAAGLKPAS